MNIKNMKLGCCVEQCALRTLIKFNLKKFKFMPRVIRKILRGFQKYIMLAAI